MCSTHHSKVYVLHLSTTCVSATANTSFVFEHKGKFRPTTYKKFSFMQLWKRWVLRFVTVLKLEEHQDRLHVTLTCSKYLSGSIIQNPAVSLHMKSCYEYIFEQHSNRPKRQTSQERN